MIASQSIVLTDETIHPLSKKEQFASQIEP